MKYRLLSDLGLKPKKREFEELKIARKAGHEAKCKKDFIAYLKKKADGEVFPKKGNGYRLHMLSSQMESFSDATNLYFPADEPKLARCIF